MRIGITGADGFLGWHLRCLLHRGTDDIAVPCDQTSFADDNALENLVAMSDAIVHFAGVNRGGDKEILETNLAITDRLIGALQRTRRSPHVLFASSIQIEHDNPYGQAKRMCAQRLEAWADTCGALFTAVVLPNVFGEFGRPFYNSVVATFCHQLAHSERTRVIVDAPIELVHAQDVVARFLALAHEGTTGTIRIPGHTPLLISSILARLQELNAMYEGGTFPALSELLDLQLFNALRSCRFPDKVLGSFDVRTDARGSLWEVARAQGPSQCFVSRTSPGATRGNHYHRHKVERFAVLSGIGRIRLRRLFTNEVHTYDLTGEAPGYVDMPTLCTHSIENAGSTPLLTLFWSDEFFDEGNPDTWSEPVQVEEGLQ
jgi:UDP-2-acetamido-2,6-beta-L-arabino-hexul-4-ose reductase